MNLQSPTYSEAEVELLALVLKLISSYRRARPWIGYDSICFGSAGDTVLVDAVLNV
jgi:hypothetical protein